MRSTVPRLRWPAAAAAAAASSQRFSTVRLTRPAVCSSPTRLGKDTVVATQRTMVDPRHSSRTLLHRITSRTWSTETTVHSSSQHEEFTTVFAESREEYVQKKRDLLDKPVGTFESKEWSEASRFLSQLWDVEPHMVEHHERVQDAFLVLERLCQETEHPDSLQPRIHRFWPRILHKILEEWRVCLQEVVRDSSSSHNRSPLPSGILSRDHVLQLFYRCTDTATGMFPPGVILYNSILKTMAKVDNLQQAPVVADQIYLRMREESELDPFNKTLHPNAKTIYHIVNMWAKSRLPNAVDRAHFYLNELTQWYEQTGRLDLKPSTRVYCAVMEANSRSSNHVDYTLDTVKDLFLEMEQRCDGEQLDSKAYTRVCHVLANIRHPDAADFAREILTEMLERRDQTPTQRTFSAVLTAYGKAGRVQEARQLLDDMEQLAEERGDPSFHPDIISYHAFLLACAEARDPQQMEAILPRMASTMVNIKGNPVLYQEIVSTILSAWARSGDENAPAQLAFIIQELEDAYRAEGSDDPFYISVYNQLLKCFVSLPKKQLAFRLARDLFRSMESDSQETKIPKPNGESYLLIMQGCRHTKQPEDCEKYLRRLIGKIRDGELSSSDLHQRHFNVSIAAWADSSSKKAPQKATAVLEMMRRLSCMPDVVSYNTMISAWAKSKDPQADQKIDQLLDEMNTLEKEGKSSIELGQGTFTPIFMRLAQTSSGKSDRIALQMADELLEKMKRVGVRPNSVNYNALMTAWSARRRPDIVERFFQNMLKDCQAGDLDLKPSYRSFVIRLHAWAHSGNPEMARTVLDEMIGASELRLIEEKPRTSDFNAVLNAWLRSSGRPEACQEAEEWLNKMIESADEPSTDCFPDVSSFGAVITTYLKNNPPGASAKVWNLFNALKLLSTEHVRGKDLQLNDVIYSRTITALLRAGDVDAVARAGELQKELMEQRLQIDMANGKLLIEEWGNLSKADYVEDIFQLMKTIHEEEHDENKRLGFELYAERFLAWSKSGDSEMANQAFSEMLDPRVLSQSKSVDGLLQSMRQLNKPDLKDQAEKLRVHLSKVSKHSRGARSASRRNNT